MLTLIATCLLAAGTTFTPLLEWTITGIVGGGRPRMNSIFVPSIACMDKSGEHVPCAEPDHSTRITMRRSLVPGQVAEPPMGCTLTLEVKE